MATMLRGTSVLLIWEPPVGATTLVQPSFRYSSHGTLASGTLGSANRCLTQLPLRRPRSHRVTVVHSSTRFTSGVRAALALTSLSSRTSNLTRLVPFSSAQDSSMSSTTPSPIPIGEILTLPCKRVARHFCLLALTMGRGKPRLETRSAIRHKDSI